MSNSLTSAQAAALLGISQRTVLRWVNKGDLPYEDRWGTGPKRAYMFDLDVVQKLAAERVLGKPDPQPTLDEACGEG